MYQVTPDEAKERLADLIAAALRGEQVIIEQSGGAAVQLVPMKRTRQPRKAGTARGMITMSPDFDASLPDFEEYAR